MIFPSSVSSTSAAGVEVSIAPLLGNRIYEITVGGQNILYFPFSALRSCVDRVTNGIPSGSWLNRIDGGGFWGKRGRNVSIPIPDSCAVMYMDCRSTEC